MLFAVAPAGPGFADDLGVQAVPIGTFLPGTDTPTGPLQPGIELYFKYQATNPNSFAVTVESIEWELATSIPGCPPNVFMIVDEEQRTVFPFDLSAGASGTFSDNATYQMSPFAGNVCQGVEVTFIPTVTATAGLSPSPTGSPAPSVSPTRRASPTLPVSPEPGLPVTGPPAGVLAVIGMLIAGAGASLLLMRLSRR